MPVPSRTGEKRAALCREASAPPATPPPRLSVTHSAAVGRSRFKSLLKETWLVPGAPGARCVVMTFSRRGITSLDRVVVVVVEGIQVA